VSAPPSRHLYVLLDDTSRRRVAACALLPIVKGDHVTLAYAAPPDAHLAEYIDEPWHEGDEITLHAVAEYASDDVQAWLVELAGSSRRKQDGGALHITVSRSATARSRDANVLLAVGSPTPRAEVLRGTLRWVLAEPENPEPSPET
jgi:hypothetical protein